jgi:hypothetical protein
MAVIAGSPSDLRPAAPLIDEWTGPQRERATANPSESPANEDRI